MENETLTITFSGSITIENVKKFIYNLEKLCAERPKMDSLIINISSSGGDVDVAIELFYFLRKLDCEIQTVNTSYVNSAAVIIYLSGDKRTCHIGSTFYIHSISKRLKGIYNAPSLLKEAKEILVNTNIVASMLEQRTAKSKKYWKTLMSKGCILDAKKALTLGLATSNIE